MKNRVEYQVFSKEEYGKTKYAVERPDGGTYCYFYDSLEKAQETCDHYNSKYYVSDYSDDEIEAWWNDIDFTPMFDFINQLVKRQLTFDRPVLKRNRWNNYEYFEYECKENLVDDNPILAAAWKEFKVNNFSAQICAKDHTGELYLWTTIHYGYEHINGGTNGAEIGYATYSTSEGWKLISSIDQWKKRYEDD